MSLNHLVEQEVEGKRHLAATLSDLIIDLVSTQDCLPHPNVDSVITTLRRERDRLVLEADVLAAQFLSIPSAPHYTSGQFARPPAEED